MAAKPIKSLAKAQTVIEVLAERGPLTAAEIADAIRAPRSSTYRLIEGLREIDLVQMGTASRIRLSTRWISLADASKRTRKEWSFAHEILRGLSVATGLTAQICVRRRAEAVCVEWSPGRGVEFLMMRPGAAYALNAGAPGRLLLAYQEDPIDFPPIRYTHSTLTENKPLQDDSERIREAGYVIAMDDIKLGMTAVGVPLFSARRQLLAALSLTGIGDDIHPRLADILQELRTAAHSIEQTYSD